jgi:hypothetical protein
LNAPLPRVVTPLGIEIEVSPVHARNTLPPIDVRDAGRLTLERALQPKKVQLGIAVIPLAIVTLVRLGLPANAELSHPVTVAGIDTDVKRQLLNASLPIEVIFGIEIDVVEVQFANA